jgi:hypothetical protein
MFGEETCIYMLNAYVYAKTKGWNEIRKEKFREKNPQIDLRAETPFIYFDI